MSEYYKIHTIEFTCCNDNIIKIIIILKENHKQYYSHEISIQIICLDIKNNKIIKIIEDTGSYITQIWKDNEIDYDYNVSPIFVEIRKDFLNKLENEELKLYNMEPHIILYYIDDDPLWDNKKCIRIEFKYKNETIHKSHHKEINNNNDDEIKILLARESIPKFKSKLETSELFYYGILKHAIPKFYLLNGSEII
jgi:hypothetical protein